jgi:sulfate permease, SulP family
MGTELKNFSNDTVRGMAAMLLALPPSVAYGLVIYAPLGAGFSGVAALSGIIGTVCMGLIVPLFGGARRLVSAPSAPAAAVLSVFVADLVKHGTIPIDVIPVYITCISILLAILQIIIGQTGGGNVIKYIPYPVVSGYLSSVSVLIILRQIPRLLGIPRGSYFMAGVLTPQLWRWDSITIGAVTVATMIITPRVTKKVPPVFIALALGVTTFFIIAWFNPSLYTLEHNPLIIGKISASIQDIAGNISHRWSLFPMLPLNISTVNIFLIPAVTLSILLCISTLNACMVLDTLTLQRHNSNKELTAQGIGNLIAALLCGIPGTGLIGPTMMNYRKESTNRIADFIVGICALLVLLFFGQLVQWIPLSALAGILMVVSVRLIDTKNFTLLKNKSTVLDFLIIILVIISAVFFGLLTAAGVGIFVAILLFLRQQMRNSVIRKKSFGNELFSKKIRLSKEIKVLEQKGRSTLILELQGQLFFGTTEQLIVKILPYLSQCKYIVLDMARVQSVDFTGAAMLKQILGWLEAKQGFLLFSSIPNRLPTGEYTKDYLKNLQLEETNYLKFFDSLDAALEWQEDQILLEGNIITGADAKNLDMEDLELLLGFSKNSVETLKLSLTERNYLPNETIFKMGDTGDEMYIVRRGLVKIMLPINDDKKHHLATVGQGGIFGEIAFIDNIRRSADAISQENTSLYILSREKFNMVTERHPEIAGKFFERLALIIGNRLRQSNTEFRVYQEN